MVVVEKDVYIFWFCLHDMICDFCEFCMGVLVLVPFVSAMYADIADVFTHDGFW